MEAAFALALRRLGDRASRVLAAKASGATVFAVQWMGFCALLAKRDTYGNAIFQVNISDGDVPSCQRCAVGTERLEMRKFQKKSTCSLKT